MSRENEIKYLDGNIIKVSSDGTLIKIGMTYDEVLRVFNMIDEKYSAMTSFRDPYKIGQMCDEFRSTIKEMSGGKENE